MPAHTDWRNVTVNEAWYQARQAELTPVTADGLCKARGFPTTERMLNALSRGVGWHGGEQRWVIPLPNIHGNIYQAKLWRNYTAEAQKKYRWMTAGGPRAAELSVSGEPVGRLFDLPWVIEHADSAKGGGWLWFLEGEWDVIMARIGGLAATCSILGAGASTPWLLDEFGGEETARSLLMRFKGIGIVYDTDNAGDVGVLKMSKTLETMCDKLAIDAHHPEWHGIRAVDLRQSEWYKGEQGWDFSDFVHAAIAAKQGGRAPKWLVSSVEGTDESGHVFIAAMFGLDPLDSSQPSLDTVFVDREGIKTIDIKDILDAGFRYAVSSGTRNQGIFHAGQKALRGGWRYDELVDEQAGERYVETVNVMFPDREPFTVAEAYEQLKRSFLLYKGQVNLADDIANMKRIYYYFPFVMVHPNRGWLWWSGEHWEAGELQVWDHVRRIPEKIDEESSRMFQAGDPLTAATLKKWAKQCRNDHKHRIMMNMAKTSLLFHPNKDLGEAWDGNPMMLGMPHGVLDLSDGRIMTGAIARDKFCSMTTRGTVASPDEIDSDPDLKRCWERWQSLLDDWLPDKDTRETVQEIMGTSMVGRLDEHIWVFQSTGRGGKSTLLDACKIAMGDYRYEISGPVVTNKATDNSKSSAIAGLDGKRLIVISEVGGRMLDAEMLKQLTGETETMGRAMRSNPQPVQNVGSYFIMTNHAVDLHGDQSEALRGRLVIVPFVRRFVDHTRLGEQEYRSARAEGSVLERSDQVKHIAMGREPGWERMPDAVLTWMFNGWERVRERGHVVFSEAMTSITNRVWAESDWLTTYFTESGLWVPDGFTVVSTPGLTQNISDWALSTDQEELNKMLLRNPSQVVAEQLKKMEGRGYQFVGKSTRALWMNGKRQVNAWRVPWTFIGG